MTNEQKLIDALERRRAFAANESVIYMTETGKALARGRAYAFDAAIKMTRDIFKLPAPPPVDECAEGGRY